MMESDATPLAEPVQKKDPVHRMRTRLAAEAYKTLGSHDQEEYEDGPKRGSSMERAMMVCLAICLFIIICMAVGYLVQFYILDHRNMGTCQTARCVEISGTIISKMDTTVDPCSDFYQYSCGRWLETTTPPASKGKWSQFTIAQNKNDELVKKILESPGNDFRRTYSTAVWKAKNTYKACMNTTSIEDKGTEPILQLISSLGSWPLFDDWSGSMWNLNDALVAAFPFASPLFGMGVMTDKRNNTQYAIIFDADGLMYDDSTFYTGNNSDMYKTAEMQYFIDVAVLLGADENEAMVLAQEIWDLEQQLAQIMTLAEDSVDPTSTYHPMTLEELQSTIGTWIDLSSYLRSLFDYDIPSTERVIVYDLKFMTQLDAILQNTPKRVLAGYIVWSVLPTFWEVMPSDFQDANTRWSKTLYGTSTLRERWQICITATDENMPYVTGGLFANQTMTKQTKNQVKEIVQHIEDAFEARLPRVNWMDNTTKRKAMNKLQNLRSFIAEPNVTPEELDAKYAELLVSADDGNAFENLKQSYMYHTKDDLKKRGGPVNRNEWDMSASKVNAYNGITENKIVITAGILQAVFFDPSYPTTMNFGAMGMIIGHELTHGFDNTGRMFDKDGNMDDWWSTESTQGFEERAQCLIDQYDGYPIGDSHNSGLLTLGENMADNGGLATSYDAYMNWLKNNQYHEPDAKLPGLNLSQEQLFFLAFAQVWCVHETDSYRQQAIRTDVHTYSPYRVRGTVSNMPEFADAYNCPAGAAMNPHHKCSVW